MTKYKVIVFDVDGTLLPFGVQDLSPRMVEMFEKLKLKFLPFFLLKKLMELEHMNMLEKIKKSA